MNDTIKLLIETEQQDGYKDTGLKGTLKEYFKYYSKGNYLLMYSIGEVLNIIDKIDQA